MAKVLVKCIKNGRLQEIPEAHAKTLVRLKIAEYADCDIADDKQPLAEDKPGITDKSKTKNKSKKKNKKTKLSGNSIKRSQPLKES